MNRFWKGIILPLFNTIKPEVIVEVGSFKGENTKNILSSYCSIYDAKLISIDPNPHKDFDLEYFNNEFGDNFKFFNSMSLDVLPNLIDYNAILIDGDHNWYTVFNELKTIEKNFNQDSFPFIILHDVSWPYARRDLYYDPDVIPMEFRHPYMKLAMFPGVEKLGKIGLNENLNNAIHENTPKNGVLTAIEDFIEDTSLDLAFYSINVFYGLGIICQNTEKNRRMILELFYESDMAGVLENIYLKDRFNKENVIKNNKSKIKSLNNSYDNLNNDFSILLDINKDLKSQLNDLEKNIDNLENNRDELENKVSELNSSLNSQNSLVKNLNKRIAEKDKDLAGLNDVIAEKDKDLAGLNDVIAEKDKDLAGLNDVIFEKDKDLIELNHIIDKNNESISILKNDFSLLLEDNKNFLNDIGFLRREIHDIKHEFSNELSHKDVIIHNLESSNETHLISITALKKENNKLKSSINILMSSKSWKLTEPFRKLMNFFRKIFK